MAPFPSTRKKREGVFGTWRGPIARVGSLSTSGEGDRRRCRRHRRCHARDATSHRESPPRHRCHRWRVGFLHAFVVRERSTRHQLPTRNIFCRERITRRQREGAYRPKRHAARIRRTDGGAWNDAKGEYGRTMHRRDCFHRACILGEPLIATLVTVRPTRKGRDI